MPIAAYVRYTGDAFTTGYESKLEELSEKFKRAKEGLRDSIGFGTWKRVVNAGEFIRHDVRSVVNIQAYFRPQV